MALQYVVLFLVIGTLVDANAFASSRAGDQCLPRTIFCADGDGKSPRYFKCIRGRLIEDVCVGGSICVGSKDTTIFCKTDGTGKLTDTQMGDVATTVTVNVSHAQLSHSLTAPIPWGAGLKSHLPSPTMALAHVLPHSWTPLPSPVAPHTATVSPNGNPIIAHATQWNFHPQQTLDQHPLTLPVASRAVPQSQLPPHAPLPSAFQSQIWPYRLPSATSGGVTSRGPIAFAAPHGLLPQYPSPQTFKLEHVMPAKPSPNTLPRPHSTAPPMTNAASPMMLAASEDIDGIAANQVLSVIGNAIFSQHPDLLTPGKDSIAGQDSEPASEHILSTLPTRQQSTSQEPDNALLAPKPGSCSPGNFYCQAHGLRPEYFACDSIGMPMPASCGPTDACYQFGRSIMCGAPASTHQPNGGLFS